MSERESCNSRHFSWLMKSCFPNPHDNKPAIETHLHLHHLHLNHHFSTSSSSLSSLPDDLLLECLSRVPPSSLSSLSSVCRRWSRLLDSPSFSSLRRLHGLLLPTVFSLSSLDSGLFSASLRISDSHHHHHHHDGDDNDENRQWKVSLFLANDAVLPFFNGLVSHARLCAIGSRIYIVNRNVMVRYDAWTRAIVSKSPMIFPRKKFATAVVSGKIYIAGGGGRTDAVEQYDPDRDMWQVVSHAPRRRYGCIGASADGVFYVIGGLKIGGAMGEDFSRASRAAAGAEAHVYASSMDLYDVEERVWLKSRAVPGGGCVVAACAAAGNIYILASHAVELSFWKFNAQRKGGGGHAGGSGGFGAWCRIKTPPLPTQVRLDSTVKFSCVGAGERVVLVQVAGCIDDLLRRSGRSERGLREGLVLMYDTVGGEWSRGPDLPEMMGRAACVSAEC